MAKRKFEMYEYRQIIVRLRLGESIRSIVQAKLACRGKVRSIRKIALEQHWLDKQHEIPTDETLAKIFKPETLTPATQSTVLQYQKQIEDWCQQGIQANVMHAALQRQYGFTGSYNAVQRFAKKVKEKLSSKITTILDFKAGECAQVDFGAGPKFVDETTGELVSTWIFVMVLAWSRHTYAEIVFRQDVETWLGCHRRAFEWFGGVPKKIIIDNAKCAITKACYYDPAVQRSYADYAEGYGFIISPCPPYDPQKKGRVESGVKYVKKNFLPLRDFRNQISEANRQLKIWLLETAGNRIHGTTHEKPLTLFEQTERILLKKLPEHPPEKATWQKVAVHTDCHITYLKCRYSAPYKLVKQSLWLRASETTVRLYRDHELVAVHPRLFVPGKRSTLEEHLPPNALAYSMRDAQWCLEQARKIGDHCEAVVKKLLLNSVVDYLRAAQGIVSLKKKYGEARLEAACHRALAFQSAHYKTIKVILQKGLEYAALPDGSAFDALTETYTGNGRFCRDTSTLLQ
jgi:transposase